MIIDSSVPYKYLVEYFDNVDTKVTLINKPDRIMGSLRIPSTLILFEEDDVEEAVTAYRMAFLSAGG